MFHPFYVKNEDGTGEWKAASNLKAGDELLSEDGKKVKVSEVKVEKLAEEITVYNLELDEVHTYYVAGGVLVHNGCGDTKTNNETGSEGGSDASVITDQSRLLETTANPQDHHIIPAFRGKSKPYAEFIKNLGIDVDQYTITVSGGKGGMHMNFIHGKGKWNQKWMDFIDNNPNATAKDIYQFAGKMMDDYGLSGLQIHPYGK